MRNSLLIAMFAATVLVPLQTSADDKVTGPAECLPYGQTSTYETLAFRSDGVQNKTTNTNKYVICPISRDQESSWTSGVDGVDISVYINRLGSGSISCTFTDGQDFSGLAPTQTITVNAVPVLGSIYGVFFEDVGIDSGFAGTITCRLPPQAKYLATRIEESGPTSP